ncbi:hypothetical protein GCHA_1401 [Paraglaciecola chathamensis S18K6]|uniref:Uncharacterized protein n=1 Tax=Paraglaciecola chathamensis S18K6 TaxID=1127672 RepID=A0AAV3UWR3_9ALTE|nr:hypothetical protein GCHA_1401 [Paraglaciecola chathamensis S18K6]
MQYGKNTSKDCATVRLTYQAVLLKAVFTRAKRNTPKGAKRVIPTSAKRDGPW